MTSIGLVACAKTKSRERQAAKDLYLSHLFMLARRYCEENYDYWYILSAYHGLLHPGSVIDPYDATLKTFRPDAREQWAARVICQAQAEQFDDPYFVFHAGGHYAKLLAGRIGDSNLPMKGLGIGQQINWYLERL